MGKGSTSTSSTTNEPPKWAKPLFQKSADVAMDLFKNESGFNPYQGSTIAPRSADSLAGIGGLRNIAYGPQSQALAQNPVNLTNDVLRSGGISQPIQNSMNMLNNVSRGGGDVTTQPYNQIFNQIQALGNQGDNLFNRFSTGQSGIDQSGYDQLQNRALQGTGLQNRTGQDIWGD